MASSHIWCASIRRAVLPAARKSAPRRRPGRDPPRSAWWDTNEIAILGKTVPTDRHW